MCNPPPSSHDRRDFSVLYVVLSYPKQMLDWPLPDHRYARKQAGPLLRSQQCEQNSKSRDSKFPMTPSLRSPAMYACVPDTPVYLTLPRSYWLLWLLRLFSTFQCVFSMHPIFLIAAVTLTHTTKCECARVNVLVRHYIALLAPLFDGTLLQCYRCCLPGKERWSVGERPS